MVGFIRSRGGPQIAKLASFSTGICLHFIVDAMSSCIGSITAIFRRNMDAHIEQRDRCKYFAPALVYKAH